MRIGGVGGFEFRHGTKTRSPGDEHIVGVREGHILKYRSDAAGALAIDRGAADAGMEKTSAVVHTVGRRGHAFDPDAGGGTGRTRDTNTRTGERSSLTMNTVAGSGRRVTGHA